MLVFRAKTRRLFAHVLDQLRPLNALRKAGKVFDQSRQRELASGLVAFEHQRFQVGACGIERGSVASTARSHNNDVADIFHSVCS